MKKISFVIGTRPEAIKMAPVIWELQHLDQFETELVLTGQHEDLGETILKDFNIKADIQLKLNRASSRLNVLTEEFFKEFMKFTQQASPPNLVLVHGDTATAYLTSMYCFHEKLKIAHVEAGLRSGNLYSPFPEEFYRRSISSVASLHFAPNQQAIDNLLAENISPEKIFLTGNTIRDAVYLSLRGKTEMEVKKQVLFTCHRRENIDHLEGYFKVLAKIALAFPDYNFFYPVHPNPAILKILEEIGELPQNIKKIDPLSHHDLIDLLGHSALVITDSGGIQEEAEILSVPSIIIRDNTEREIEDEDSALVGGNLDLMEEKANLILEKTTIGTRKLGQTLHGPSALIRDVVKNYLS